VGGNNKVLADRLIQADYAANDIRWS